MHTNNEILISSNILKNKNQRKKNRKNGSRSASMAEMPWTHQENGKDLKPLEPFKEEDAHFIFCPAVENLQGILLFGRMGNL